MRIGRVLAITCAPVAVAAVLVLRWSDAQPHTNHVANYLVLLGVVAYGVLVMEWWVRR